MEYIWKYYNPSNPGTVCIFHRLTPQDYLTWHSEEHFMSVVLHSLSLMAGSLLRMLYGTCFVLRAHGVTSMLSTCICIRNQASDNRADKCAQCMDLSLVCCILRFQCQCFSNTPHRWTDTQGCGVGLADVKLSPFIDTTLFDTET